MLLKDFKELLSTTKGLGNVPASEQRILKISNTIGAPRVNELVGDSRPLQPALHVYTNQPLYLEYRPKPKPLSSKPTPPHVPGGDDPTPSGTGVAKPTANRGRARGRSKTSQLLAKRGITARSAPRGPLSTMSRIKITAANSPAVAAYEREVNSIKVWFNSLGDIQLTKHIMVDRRQNLRFLRVSSFIVCCTPPLGVFVLDSIASLSLVLVCFHC